MSDIAIRVENLGKAYKITHNAGRGRYKTLQEDVIGLLKRPFSRNGDAPRSEMFWALKDISFEVKQGEVLGIIGRNGAGKSTLLKILSRITRPTTGYAEMYGRIGSLLEVGTGFHPELTGRENIFLNGAVLGMTRRDIQRKFDEIVQFAEVEQFLDTPVKRYSSGMYMRLAFAVAAHLEPEILVVDEVLAVGDAEFQKKSLGKMDEVAKSGRTVLFVSHNMAAVEALCQQAMLIENGRIIRMGKTVNVVGEYIRQSLQNSGASLAGSQRSGTGGMKITSFHLEDADGSIVENAKSGSLVVFSFGFENYGIPEDSKLSLGFSVQSEQHIPLFYYYSHFSGVYFYPTKQHGFFKCTIPDLPLANGTYLLGCRLIMNGDEQTGEEVDFPKITVPFTVNTVDYFGTSSAFVPTWGPILVRGTWSISEQVQQTLQPDL